MAFVAWSTSRSFTRHITRAGRLMSRWLLIDSRSFALFFPNRSCTTFYKVQLRLEENKAKLRLSISSHLDISRPARAETRHR